MVLIDMSTFMIHVTLRKLVMVIVMIHNGIQRNLLSAFRNIAPASGNGSGKLFLL